MNKEKPEYQTCIMSSQQGNNKSLCGRAQAKLEFHFVNVDHWLNNRLCKGRLVGCPDCLKIVKKAIGEECEILDNDD